MRRNHDGEAVVSSVLYFCDRVSIHIRELSPQCSEALGFVASHTSLKFRGMLTKHDVSHLHRQALSRQNTGVPLWQLIPPLEFDAQMDEPPAFSETDFFIVSFNCALLAKIFLQERGYLETTRCYCCCCCCKCCERRWAVEAYL